MITAARENSKKNRRKDGWRMASKTIRKLTAQTLGQSERMTLPERLVCHLDMLHFMIDCTLPKPNEDQEIYWLNDDICLQYEKIGSPVFFYKYSIYMHGEHVGQLLTHTRNNIRIKDGVCKLEIANHLFYSDYWLEVYNTLMDELRAELRNISQLHIAIDGCNHLYHFLNAFDKQTADNAIVKMKGKASFDKKQIRHFMAQNFKIGGKHKYFTVYNKTSEIEKVSNKEYIRNVWAQNGFDLSSDVWRCELRMDSQGVKELMAVDVPQYDDDGNEMYIPGYTEFKEGVDINRLIDPNYCLAIFRTQTKNFFEFVINTNDGNISREDVIDLFGFELRQVKVLGKVKRALSRGVYKAKMGIHNAVQNILLRHIDDGKSVKAALTHVVDNLELYDLWRYYFKKLPDWIGRYQPSRTSQDYNKYKMMLLNAAPVKTTLF